MGAATAGDWEKRPAVYFEEIVVVQVGASKYGVLGDFFG
jgi:hypothetical protein